jgi:gas vesicle protein
MLSGDLKSEVNLACYLQKKNQLTRLFIQNQKDLDGLEELVKLFKEDSEKEIQELKDLVAQYQSRVAQKCDELVQQFVNP